MGADPEEFSLTKDDLLGADINKLPLTHPKYLALFRPKVYMAVILYGHYLHNVSVGHYTSQLGRSPGVEADEFLLT
jgi:hypothetical protein